jgi:membrane protease YdiL (CAAX protease family)
VKRLLVAALGFAPLVGLAEPIDAALLGGSPAASVRLEEIGAGLEQSFERAVALYDAEIAAEPYRLRAQISRCEFVELFPLQFEGASFSDEVYERADECEQDLLERFPDHPEVALWQLGRTFPDDERLAAGEALLELLDVHGWTAGQRARLYTELATVSERLDVEGRFRGRSADYARRALQYDIRADVRLILAAQLLDAGDRAAAFEALTSPFDDQQDAWHIVRKMGYLARLDARDAVVALHGELDGTAYYDRTEAAAALRAVGELELARRELEGATYYGTADERQRFVLALEQGDAEGARAAYDTWRDEGFWEDPFGINRFALFVAYPGLPWQARDVLGALGALALLSLLLVAWWVPLGLIHYRGLANRVRGAELTSSGVRLRDAWLGLATLSLSSFLALYTIGPFDLFADAGEPWAVGVDQQQAAHLLVRESLLAIVLAAIVAYMLRRHLSRWWATDWSIGRCVLVGCATALIARVPLFGVVLSGVDIDAALRIDNSMWATLSEVDALYGSAVAFWVLSMVAPVGEEFVFRGLLLRASLSHVSFPIANVAQALLFAVLHFEPAATPFLFGFGLVAGWLARRSGGLLAPMVMHAIFNLAVGLLIAA